MEDRYFSKSQSVLRLVSAYKKHGTLKVAFDFDNTVFDTHKLGDTYDLVEILLKLCKKKGFILILFSCREDERLQEAITYCQGRGYNPDFVNESPDGLSRKPNYDILLDDRAGLKCSYEILLQTIRHI